MSNDSLNRTNKVKEYAEKFATLSKDDQKKLIENTIKHFNENEEIKEESLKKLFNTFKSNTDKVDVYLKVVALNKMYNAGLTDNEMTNKVKQEYTKGKKKKPVNTKLMEEHIVNKNNLFNSNEFSEIIKYIKDFGDEYKSVCSFASKYVFWTFYVDDNNVEIPIYDSKARTLLYYIFKFNETNKNKYSNYFSYDDKITQNYFYDYTNYCRAYKKFIEVFGFQNMTYKEADKFLWQYAKDIEKESSKKTAQHI